MKQTILVLGGTGTLGKPTARSLKDAGFRVRIMSRDAKKAREIFGDTHDIFDGDPMDTACLEEALHGCYGVHISLPPEVEQPVAESVAKTAKTHGIERITYISGATVAEENRWFPMVNQKFLAEKAIQAAGIPYTIFRPTWMMESLLLFVVQGRASVLGKQPYPYHWVAGDDLARMISTAYRLADAENKRFTIYGPEGIRMHEALRRTCAALYPDIKQVSTMPLWLVGALATLMRNPGLKFAGEMMAYFEKAGEMGSPEEANRCLGAPSMTLDKWLEERKARSWSNSEDMRQEER